MSGTLNKNNKDSTFTDSGYSIKIGKIDRFIMMVNIEELAFGNSTPRADLMLLYRNKADTLQIVLFELKNVKALLRSNKISDMSSHILRKFHSTMSLFENANVNGNTKVGTTKLDGIFSNIINDSKDKYKTFYLVAPDEFKAQISSIISKIKEKNRKKFDLKFLTENEKFIP